MDEAEAWAIFERFLTDKAERTGTPLAPLPTATRRFPGGWTFGYQSRAFVETSHFTDMLVGHGPVVVRSDGAVFEGGSLDREPEDVLRRHNETLRRAGDTAPGPAASWRPMRAADLPDVRAIAAAVHPDYPEDEAVFAERLALFPAGCLVLDRSAGPMGYLIAHPWRLGTAPKLNTLLGALPERPDTLYLHDLALRPEARGAGAARAAVERAVGIATPYGPVSLVAVAGAAPFWARMGFRDLSAVPASTLAAYDPTARAMIRP